MSERALAFVEEWIADHVDAKDAAGDSEARAKALAGQCLAHEQRRFYEAVARLGGYTTRESRNGDTCVSTAHPSAISRAAE